MPKVVILGGGVGGLSAAHELVNRGFEVEVYERNPVYWGGKARSIDYTHQGQYSKPLPGEHGFRFFPGFYQHITQTMREIPFVKGGKASSVYDNLVPTSRIMIARYGLPAIVTPASFPRSLADLALIIKDLHADTGLTTEETDFFAQRVWQMMTSCADRFNNDYERISWWQFTQAERFSEAYRHLLVEGLTRTLVAAQAQLASTKTGGGIFLQLLYCMTDPSVNTDRILNGPTNDQWLNPWMTYLRSKGVRFTHGVNLTALQLNADKTAIASVTITPHADVIHNGQEAGPLMQAAANKAAQLMPPYHVSGDYYVLATPVERAAPLISDDMVKIDGTLQYIRDLAPSTAWMNGIQFYLNVDVPVNKGHVICSDSQWALTCISQIQFWDGFDIAARGNGQVRGLLSVDISDWFTPGKFTTTKPANECTREEVAEEVWAQLKASLNVSSEVLRDDMRVDHYLDRDIRTKPTSQMSDAELKNTEPLLVNKVNTWALRPDADCGIPNLFFASDYVRTNTDIATMEGANEASRRAVNCLLDSVGSDVQRCDVYPLNEPFCFAPLKWYDQRRFQQGLPWTPKAPWWLEAITFVLGLVYLGLGLLKSFAQSILNWLGVRSESAFVVASMVVTLGVALLAAHFQWGYQSASYLAFGMFAALWLYAHLRRDHFLKRLLVFGLAAGCAELIADNWLVNTLQSLLYPATQSKIWASPNYMPFAWAVILVQVGYLGYLIGQKKSMLTAFFWTFLIGMCFIPIFECCAKWAGWWYYVPSSHMFANTPYYIILGEGLICFMLPLIYQRAWISRRFDPVISGVLQGLWIFAAYYLSYRLLA